jgi:hypothetical protein
MSEVIRPSDVSTQRRVNEVCLRLEAAWQAHQADPASHPRPRPEDYLGGVPAPATIQ